MLKIYQHSLVALVPFVKPTLQTFALLFLELGPFEIALRCTNDKMPFSKSTDPTTDWLLGEWLEGEWIQLRNSINSQSVRPARGPGPGDGHGNNLKFDSGSETSHPET